VTKELAYETLVCLGWLARMAYSFGYGRFVPYGGPGTPRGYTFLNEEAFVAVTEDELKRMGWAPSLSV